MDNRPDHLRVLRWKRKLRQFLAAVVIFLVFLGGIAAGVLLHQGFRDSRPDDEARSALHTQSQPEVTETDPTEPTTEPTQAPTEAPTETTAPTTLPPEVDTVQSIMDTMTMEEKLCQLFVVAPESLSGSEAITAAPESLADDLLRYPVGGIVLFGQNLVDREQTATLIAAHQELSRIPLFVGVDEEGGMVSRLGANAQMGVTHFPAMLDIGATGDLSRAYQVGYTLGTELLDLGFNLDFAPVADVLTEEDNTVIGNRAFSTDADLASQMVSACVQGFQEAGLMSSLKHFPGHGNTSTDSHLGYAAAERTLEELRQTEFLPFTAGIEAGAPVVMVGHISLPKVTGSDIPSSLSPMVITDILRTELGFTGLIVTDAMNMGAVTEHYTSGEAAVLAITAGCDLILMPEDLPQALNALQEALENGTITAARIDESVRRILTMKLEYGILGDQF